MTVREIPRTRLAAIGWLVLVLVVAGVGAWEWKMRTLGLEAGDLDDSPAHWAVERERLDTGEHDDIVIIGQSRILFDTDFGVWYELTGRRPVQLALPGTNARPFLTSIADDTDFEGLVLCDVQQESFFSKRLGGLPEFIGMEKTWRDESPSTKFGHQVDLLLQDTFAFLDDEYTLTKLIDRIKFEDDRAGFNSPYYRVWKLSQARDHRQYYLWHRILRDEYLREHARQVWSGPRGTRPPVPKEEIDQAMTEILAAVRKIEARGGVVVFIRPPSTGPYYAREEKNAPRAATWDRLLRETGAFGIHFEDYPEMQNLNLPEWSHLARRDATRFTRAYVEALRQRYVWLRPGPVLHPGP